MGRCPKPAIHPGEKSSCWEVEWCWNSYQVVVSGHQSMDSIFYITLPLAIRIQCFSTPFLVAAGYGKGAFSLKSLLKNNFKSVVQERNIETLPTSASWRSPFSDKNQPVYPSSSYLAPALPLFTAGPWAVCLSSPLSLWITLGFTSRISERLLLHSLGKPACLKMSRKTLHSLPPPPQIWDDYKKRKPKKEIIGSSFLWCWLYFYDCVFWDFPHSLEEWGSYFFGR